MVHAYDPNHEISYLTLTPNPDSISLTTSINPKSQLETDTELKAGPNFGLWIMAD